MATREPTKAEANQIKRYCQRYGCDGLEIGGFVLKWGEVTLEPNQSPTPWNSFRCNWFKYSLEDLIADWHSHPVVPNQYEPNLTGNTDMLSPADYEHAQQLNLPAVMIHSGTFSFDYYDPRGLTTGVNLQPQCRNAGHFHPEGGQQLVRTDNPAIWKINQAEEILNRAWKDYLTTLKKATQMMKEADQKRFEELRKLATQCEDSQAASRLAGQAARLEAAKYTQIFLSDFKR